MKISIIGAGNVGSITALRLAQENLGEVVLVDIIKGIACGKAFDMQDAAWTTKINYAVSGSDDFNAIAGSAIVVVTAGLARKPGMTREELLAKNAAILKDVCLRIKELCPESVVVVVTNPLDLMTYLAHKVTGFKKERIIGMGASLDSTRFANIICAQLKARVSEVEAVVIGPHGEGMLPLPRFSSVKGVTLDQLCDEKSIEEFTKKTVNRGAEIVSLLGSGSAYFAPSAAAADLVRAIAKDEKRTIGACAYLSGEYGLKDLCIGVPCRIGRTGIESIIELKLNEREGQAFKDSADKLRALQKQLNF